MKNDIAPFPDLYFRRRKASAMFIKSGRMKSKAGRERMVDGFLSIKEAIDKYIAGCQTKVRMTDKRLLGKAIMAGALIGMGAAASSVAAHTITDVGIARLVAAMVFPVGLMMVILLGAELFTGDCLAVMGVAARKCSVKDIVRVLVVVYFGNLIGASFLAVLIAMSGQLDYSAGMLGAYTIKIAVGKAGISFGKAMVSGMLCNVLVCAAVLMAMCAKDIAGKLLAVFFVIMLFVTAGFEHCVANMYYITAGLAAKSNPVYLELAMEQYGYTTDQLAVLNIENYILGNLLPVTIGNILGGIVLLGLPLFYMNRDSVRENERKIVKEGINHDVIYPRGIASTGN